MYPNFYHLFDMLFNIENSFDVIYRDIVLRIEDLWPKILWAAIIMIVGIIIARIVFLFLRFFFKKIKLNEIIDRLKISFDQESLQETDDEEKKQEIQKPKNRFTEKIKVDDVVSKSVSYYLVIVFLRLAIGFIGITEIEAFLKDVISYLPNLFVWVLIGFFGIRFANFVYDVIFHTLSISKEKSAKIIAEAARIIILFFTLLVFLDYTQIVSMFIINTVLIGFVSMVALAWWLAFGIWGKDIAKEIIDSFKK